MDNNNNNNIDNNINDEIEDEGTKCTIIINLGSIPMKSISQSSNDNDNCHWIINNELTDEKLPFHPLLQLENFNQLMDYSIRNTTNAADQGWKEEIVSAKRKTKSKWKMSLLKGVRLSYPNGISDINSSYMVYARRDYEVQRGPITNSNRTDFVDVFNCVEVSYQDDDSDEMKFTPAKIMGIVKLSRDRKKNNNNDTKVLFVIAYLRQVSLLSLAEKSLYLANSLYQYWFEDTFLCFDIITSERIIGPLHCLYDIHRKPDKGEGEWSNRALNTAKKYRFIIQYPFQNDLKDCDARITTHYHKVRIFPLYSPSSHKLEDN